MLDEACHSSNTASVCRSVVCALVLFSTLWLKPEACSKRGLFHNKLNPRACFSPLSQSTCGVASVCFAFTLGQAGKAFAVKTTAATVRKGLLVKNGAENGGAAAAV